MVGLEGTSNPKEKDKNTPSFLEVRRSDETEPWSATAGYLQSCCTQNFMAGASTKNWIFSGTHPSLNFKEPSPSMFHYSKHYKEKNIKYKAESELALNIIFVHLSHQNTWFLAKENYGFTDQT